MNWLLDVKYCAEECQRQESGEISVYNMCFALHYARGMYNDGISLRSPYAPFIDMTIVEGVGRLVEPEKANRYRHIPVTVNNKIIPWENIYRQISNLILNQKDITPDEFYKEFEEIHPFVDGNGRVGSILWNWLNGTLDNPTSPPKIF